MATVIDDKTIGQAFKSVRESSSLTQGQLAILLGLGQRTIDRIEKGQRQLRFREALLLQNKLGISLEVRIHGQYQAP